jgi:hypothetical protein
MDVGIDDVRTRKAMEQPISKQIFFLSGVNKGFQIGK